MISKKYRPLWFILLVLLLPSPLFANGQFRMALTAGSDFSERPSYSDIGASLSDPVNVFEGVILEVITRQIVGFGARGLIRFTETAEPIELQTATGWWFDWNGQVFLSAHLLGGGSFVDPFVEVGYGVVGRACIASSQSGVWSEDAEGLWSYTWYGRNDEGVTNLSLFPVVSGGVAFDLTGLLLGIRIAYRPIVNAIPATPIENYPLTRFHIDFFGGVALGGHR